MASAGTALVVMRTSCRPRRGMVAGSVSGHLSVWLNKEPHDVTAVHSWLSCSLQSLWVDLRDKKDTFQFRSALKVQSLLIASLMESHLETIPTAAVSPSVAVCTSRFGK